MNNLDALQVAARLQTLGVDVRSVELKETVDQHVVFRASGGNRAMRRAAARSTRRRGR